MKKNLVLFLLITDAALNLVGAQRVSANEGHGMLSKLPDKERNSTLTRFLKQSNENCDAAIKNFFQGFDKERNAYWNVACRNKKSFVIMIKNDKAGSTKIMDCSVLKMLKAGECFKKF